MIVSLSSFVFFQSEVTSQETISTPFNVTHLLHVDQDNVEEFMSKLAESRTGSTATRPKILRSKQRDSQEKRSSRGLSMERGKQTEGKQKTAPKPPARPVSCIMKVNSDHNLQRNGSQELCSTDIPPRPKQRPASMTVTASKDVFDVQQTQEQRGTLSENVDGPKLDDFEAPKLPPRRPPRFVSSSVEKSVNCNELEANNDANEGLYSTIDETSRMPVKPRTTLGNSDDGAVRPPLPPRQLSIKQLSCPEDETGETVPSAEELLSSPDPSSEDSTNKSLEKSGTPSSTECESSADDKTGFLLEGVDPKKSVEDISVITDDNSKISEFDLASADNNTQTSESIDVSDLYGVIDKPRPARSSLKIQNDQNEYPDVPLPGQSAPPLPPRTRDSFIKKGPPLPPRPNLE